MQEYDSTNGKYSIIAEDSMAKKQIKKSKKVVPEEDDDYSSSEGDHYVSIKEKAVELGPVRNRKCRDFFFLVLFAVFWAGMAIVAVIAVQNGNLISLL